MGKRTEYNKKFENKKDVNVDETELVTEKTEVNDDPTEEIVLTGIVKIKPMEQLAIRNKPSSDGEVIGHFVNGDKVKIGMDLSPSSDFYSIINHTVPNAYCMKKYIELDK